MRAAHSFNYAILRVVPCLERGEFVNVGIVLFCKPRGFLQARVHLPAEKLTAMRPDIDLAFIQQHLDAFPRVCLADPEAGPIARLTIRERFYWMAAPRSTMIQVSAVHAGMCDDPERTLEELFNKLVL